MPIKVLIVDDSELVRQMLTEMLKADPMIEVVGAAEDPYHARQMIKELHPDVLTLDVEMPKMDGVTFLKNLMRLHPLPVVMISTLTEKGADVTFEAMDLGAVDFVTKPKIDLHNTFEDYALEIRRKVKTASRVSRYQLERQYARYVANKEHKPAPVQVHVPSVPTQKLTTDAVLPKRSPTMMPGVAMRHKLIAIGSSTGGTEAIKELLLRLPEDTPPIVITQHIPAAFSLPFATRMNNLAAMTVHHAENGMEILHGHVYIAPGDHHLLVMRQGGKLVCQLHDGPPVNRHKPSVDVMFRSVEQAVGKKAVGVILTGMGADGAQGLKELREIGVHTIAQDEKTSVVWGMPGESVKIGAAEFVLPLEKIAQKMFDLAVS
ncbi:chemotaxis response regulator protein-glutamate methylesterase of group 1 operon [Thiosulfatimonas sediminis]|uniref:Protein-glutamate methylesterase/protein-glutamine glutaminase n=1 Tax=Thiosulfatimonas sediminis TaxID=2675054 RepID=A0A6F8PTY1_9GAMM|nr:chemotaxis response regulator protein-glutamate methylesterase [Thiosulfatimonas sediminis]BBP45569.1 chemotaxis response regulator protein-glutamate methylesterase of group 1 operon [Thiosulfatimonas sediminis]